MRPGIPLLIGLCAAGCDSDPKPTTTAPPSASPAASVAAAPSADPGPQVPASKREPATFAASDGVALAGDFYSAADKRAPAVVFIHRFRGDRTEFRDVADLLAKSVPRYHVLNFDLRGHGDSKTAKLAKGAKVKQPRRSYDWTTMKPKDMSLFTKDVKAAIEFALAASDGQSDRVVLLGSSLGAALAADVAGDDRRVSALGLISPGAAIEGFDLYKRFAEVRTLPTLLMGSKQDTVAADPLTSLQKMSPTAVVKLYDAKAHGAAELARNVTEFPTDVQAWCAKVFDEKPRPRLLENQTPRPKRPPAVAAQIPAAPSEAN